MKLSWVATSKRKRKKAKQYKPYNPITGNIIRLVIWADTKNGVYYRYKPDENGMAFLNASKTEIVREFCHGPVRFRRVV